jgi:DNA repair exonuclease SbcCD ATPase subunit
MNMGYSDEVNRRLEELKRVAKDFTAAVSGIDNNFDAKLTEIKALELRREKLSGEVEQTRRTATEVMQDATERASEVTKNAERLLSEAQALKSEAIREKTEATKIYAEAESLRKMAEQRQREADTQWRIIEARNKKLEDALRG